MRAQKITVASQEAIKVADEVWIATALLHRSHPDRKDFTTGEILEKARAQAITGELRPGVRVHILQHCVANRAPNPGRYRMLYATGKRTRRLFRLGDPYHPAREGAKVVPEKEELPEKYQPLLEWYWSEYGRPAAVTPDRDPILGLRGTGKEIWADEDPDSYVRRLREGWE